MNHDEQRHRETLWFSAYTGQMALLWQQVTYVQLTAAAAFGGWYLTWSACHWIISCIVLLGGIAIQCLLILIIRRHAQILQEFTSNLHKTQLIDQNTRLVGLFGMTSHALARYACAFFVVASALIAVGTIADQFLPRYIAVAVLLIFLVLALRMVYKNRRLLMIILIGVKQPRRLSINWKLMPSVLRRRRGHKGLR